MKNPIVSLLFIALFCAHAVSAQVTFVRDGGGAWSDLSQWHDDSSGANESSTRLPGEGDVVKLNGKKEVSLDMDVYISTFEVAGGRVGGLNLDQPFSLQAETTSVGSPGVSVFRFINLTKGALDVNGDLIIYDRGRVVIDGGLLGNVFAGRQMRHFQGAGHIELKSGRLLMLGESSKNKVVFDVALTVVSGGLLQVTGQAQVGRDAAAELQIVGDTAKIHLQSLNQQPQVASLGTFRFVFNKTGVSPIEVESLMHLNSAKLIVDGSAYRGGDQAITLFQSAQPLTKKIRSENLEVLGLGDEGSGWELIQDKESGSVKIVIKGRK